MQKQPVTTETETHSNPVKTAGRFICLAGSHGHTVSGSTAIHTGTWHRS